MEIKEMREGRAGYHYYQTFSDCPRLGYFKYVLGLQYDYTKPALIFGGAIHEGVKSYYAHDYSIDAAVETFKEVLDLRRKEYEKPSKCDDDMIRGIGMLKNWYETWGESDRENYDIIEFETEHRFFIGPNEDLEFAIRCDRLVKDKRTGMVYVVDVKTTGWSVSGTFKNVDCDDQMTGYIWGAKKAYPDLAIEGAIVDVMYNRGSVFKAERSPTPIIRSNYDLMAFELNQVSKIIETSQKVQALKDYPNEVVFPRRGAQCAQWGCDFEAICRKNVTMDYIPVGYHKDDWASENNMFEKAKSFSILDLTKGDK